MNIEKLKKFKRIKIKELITDSWIPYLNRDYVTTKKRFFHRQCEEENKIDGIDKILEKLKEIWTPIEIMEFTKMCWEVADGDIVGPCKEFHSLLVLMYLITEGLSFEQINEIIPTTTFRRLFEQLFGGGTGDLKAEEKRKKWHERSEKWFDRLSTAEIRCAHAKIFNPDSLKQITTLMDGKDFIIKLQLIFKELRKTSNDKSNLISRKNKKGSSWMNAAKCVNLFTIEGYPLRNTFVVGANEKYDGHLAEGINLLQVLSKSDCIMADHHFDKFIRELFSVENEKNYELENPFNEENYLLKPKKKKY